MLDFRSDTVTKPCPSMFQAMCRAPLGDDVYGEDPSVRQLEEFVADLLQKEAALFVPSGTMANQIALHAQSRHGDAVICERNSHIFLFEGGAAAAQSGLQPVYADELEPWTPQSLGRYFVPMGPHTPPTTIVSIENTHNWLAGRVLELDTLGVITTEARSLGLKVHCDGARLWNAAVALQVPEAALTKGIDSVAVCFSKGLGAPVGSALVGSFDLIAAGRRIRKRWGGAMRQSGILAAAALFALRHNRQRLEEDHLGARTFAAHFRERLSISYPDCGTNIVYFDSTNLKPAHALSDDAFVALCREKGILLQHLAKSRCRLVWHKDLGSNATKTLMDVFDGFWEKAQIPH